MQLSNEPAEELAKVLVDSGGKDSTGQNNFELCGIVAGGSEAMEGVIKLARQVTHDSYHRIIMCTNWGLPFPSSSMKPANRNARISSRVIYPITGTQSQPSA